LRKTQNCKPIWLTNATYQLIYGDNGGYSGSGIVGTNMSGSGGTFAGHGAVIVGFGYSKVRAN